MQKAGGGPAVVGLSGYTRRVIVPTAFPAGFRRPGTNECVPMKNAFRIHANSHLIVLVAGLVDHLSARR